jgi:diguanylate cyclase (GGDEF)-like protein
MTGRVPLRFKFFPYALVALAYILYLIVFAFYHDYAQVGISSLLVIPVIVGSWYFGVRGGLLIAALSILTTVLILILTGQLELVFVPSNYLRTLTTVLVAVIVGRFGAITRDRLEALGRLEALQEITRTTLEASDLESTLKALVERIAKLFEANDALFAFWDEDTKLTTPAVAYGALKEIYPKIVYPPGERTLTRAVMEAGRPLAIQDIKTSTLIRPEVAARFPSRSMLGIPLIVQGKKIASFSLGYNRIHDFAQDEIRYAEAMAQQIALVLAKIQLLEDAQKQVRQLSVLHKVASIATQVDTIDRLIESTTEIIGKSLFPDNVGVLLMDEEQGVLRPHPSYQFRSDHHSFPLAVAPGQGITGKVAETGQPIRIGDVKSRADYLNIDQNTASELCVPIRLKGRLLGVVNAESHRIDAFSLDDELLLGTLAGQLATTMEEIRTAEAERQWLNQLAHSNELIYALAQITTHMEKALTQQEIMETIGRELRKIDLICIVATFDTDKEVFTISHTSINPGLLAKMENAVGFSFLRHTFSFKKLHAKLNTDGILQPAFLANPEDELQLLFTRSHEKGVIEFVRKIGFRPGVEYLRLPLVFENTLLGLLWVWGKGILKSDMPIMATLAKHIGTSLERARLFQEVQSLALTDPLTGLQNRRSLFALGRIEFARSLRTDRPFSCMLLDVDHFKQINDRYGHTIGDQVLYEVAARCKRSVREIDLTGRYGGEELVILLPETEAQTALQVAERVRAAIERPPIKVSDHELQVTVSIGVSRKDEHTLQLETLIARADQAMYIAKHKGRNQVAISK